MNASCVAGWAARRERGSAVLLRVMAWLTLTLGRPVGRALLPPITAWFLATSPTARTASREYLSLALGRRAGLVDVARHFHAFASAILDRAFLITGRTAGLRIDTEGLEHLEAALATGRGCVLLGAHLGSFEVLCSLGRAAPVPVRPLMFRRNAGALSALLDRLAPGLRDSVIEIGDAGSMLRAHESVARGEIVGILADRAPVCDGVVPARMVRVPFLGRMASFPAGPFILASTLDAPVVLFQAVRTDRNRYAIRFTPFAPRILLPRASRAAALCELVGRYAAAVEAGCRAHPFEWFNFFPFWEGSTDDTPRPQTDAASDAAGPGRGEAGAGAAGSRHAPA